MNILADLHHNCLYHSLQLLFEERLGFDLYRPIELEWYEQGYWHIFPHIDTAKQFLGTDQAFNTPKDIHGEELPPGARVNEHYTVEDGIYYVKDVTRDVIQRGISLDKFKEMKFDILIASIPQHIRPFQELIRLYQPQAKLIFQVGNAWGYQQGVQNILASTSEFSVPSSVNICFYHQEFSPSFSYQDPPEDSFNINSYIHYMQGKEIMNKAAQALPHMKFTSYGAGMEDHIMKISDQAQAYKDSAFTWHFKPGGDGYGHNIHRSFACGRPVIYWGSQYRGKLAEKLFEDGVTSLDAEKHGLKGIVAQLDGLSKDRQWHRQLCQNTHEKFKKTVDFDAQELCIRDFLSRLI